MEGAAPGAVPCFQVAAVAAAAGGGVVEVDVVACVVAGAEAGVALDAGGVGLAGAAVPVKGVWGVGWGEGQEINFTLFVCSVLSPLTPPSHPSFHPSLPAQVALLESIPTHTPLIRQMQRLQAANVHRRTAAAAAAAACRRRGPHLGTQQIVPPLPQSVQWPKAKDLSRAFLEQGTRGRVVCLG